jgi:phosphoribosylformylglycinamidine synthase
MVGELPDPAAVPGQALREGDAIAVAGPFAPSLQASELAKLRGELGTGLPEFELPHVQAAHAAIREAARAGSLSCIHDISDGGLAVALAEAAIAGGIGVSASLGGEDAATAADELLFGEGPGGFIVSGSREALAELGERVYVTVIGEAGGDRLEISAAGAELDVGLSDAGAAWRSLGDKLAH